MNSPHPVPLKYTTDLPASFVPCSFATQTAQSEWSLGTAGPRMMDPRIIQQCLCRLHGFQHCDLSDPTELLQHLTPWPLKVARCVYDPIWWFRVNVRAWKHRAVGTSTCFSFEWYSNIMCCGRAVQASSSYGPLSSPTPSLQSDAACQRLAGARQYKGFVVCGHCHWQGSRRDQKINLRHWPVPNRPSRLRGRKATWKKRKDNVTRFQARSKDQEILEDGRWSWTLVSPEEIMSREMELGWASWTSLLLRVVQVVRHSHWTAVQRTFS